MPRKAPPVTDWDTVPVVFDVPMMARISGYTPETVAKKAQRGELPGKKDENDGEWRFEKSAVMKFYGVDPLASISSQQLLKSIQVFEATLNGLAANLNNAAPERSHPHE